MKYSFFCLLFSCLFLCANGQKVSFFEVPALRLDLTTLYEEERKWRTDTSLIWDMGAFEMSEQITLGAYKLYLEDIKKDSSKAFYISQLPDSSIASPAQYSNYLESQKYDQLPVSGISWNNAMNYARWLSYREMKGGKLHHLYRLPEGSEWLVARHYLDSIGQKHDLGTSLSDWGIENYYEGMSYPFSCCNCVGEECSLFFSKPNDGRAWKRRVVFGSSFWKSRRNFILNDWEFADLGRVDIGFRLVKESVKDSSSHIKMVLKYWNTYSYYEDVSDNYNHQKYKNGLKVKANRSLKRKEFIFEQTAYKTKVIAQESKGKLDGIYQSFYENGQLKAKGTFVAGQRNGIWELWDERGRLVTKRKYENGLTYKRLFPKTENKLEQFLFRSEVLPQKRDSTGLYKWYIIHEKEICWERRIYKSLPKAKNPFLFSSNKLPELLIKAWENGKITAYKDGHFVHKVPDDSLSCFSEKVGSVNGLKLHEIGFIHDHFHILDYRILGIGLMNGSTEVLWFYYPEVRSILKKEKVETPYKHLKHLDDLFHFHYYFYDKVELGGLAVKEIQVKIALESDVDLIEFEHSNWIYFLAK